MSEPMVQVAMVGTGTGDGGAPLRNGTVAETPGKTQPNVVLRVVRPFVAILVRFGHTFGTSLIGLVTAGITPLGDQLIGASDFMGLVGNCATLALAPAGLGLLKDVVTIFGKLEGKFPLLTGNI